MSSPATLKPWFEYDSAVPGSKRKGAPSEPISTAWWCWAEVTSSIDTPKWSAAAASALDPLFR